VKPSSQDVEDEYIRVRFPLERDEDGWPPSDVETMWCTRISPGLCKIDNVPIYALGVAVDDVIEVAEVDGRPTFVRVISHSGHGTVRVIFLGNESPESTRGSQMWTVLLDAGCTFEGLRGSKLYALDVPSAAAARVIAPVLQRGLSSEIFDYEEAKPLQGGPGPHPWTKQSKRRLRRLARRPKP